MKILQFLQNVTKNLKICRTIRINNAYNRNFCFPLIGKIITTKHSSIKIKTKTLRYQINNLFDFKCNVHLYQTSVLVYSLRFNIVEFYIKVSKIVYSYKKWIFQQLLNYSQPAIFRKPSGKPQQSIEIGRYTGVNRKREYITYTYCYLVNIDLAILTSVFTV